MVDRIYKYLWQPTDKANEKEKEKKNFKIKTMEQTVAK